MRLLRQFRDPKLSIWQSALDEVIAKNRGVQRASLAPGAPGAAPSSRRPDITDAMVAESVRYCSARSSGELPVGSSAARTGQPAGAGLLGTLGYCSMTAMKLAEATLLGNQQDCQRYKDELGKFTDCDPLYAEAAAKYAEYFIAQCKKIPYRVYQNLNEFVLEGKLPAQARIAILGDWGTGLESALNVLAGIAAKKPDAVIHLGDVYYSGTAFENQKYFYEPWARVLDLAHTKIPTFTLSGNHDMYSGGAGYYHVMDQIGQPASYFCLRNGHWQFLAMDTGLHDSNPASGGAAATYLEDTEVVWLKDKMDTAGSRRTVLLSHHPLFTAYEEIDGSAVNLRLYPQVFTFFPKVDLWLWGHEHNFVVYGPYRGVQRARCIGHGGFPMGVDEAPSQPRFPQVPLLTKDAHGNALTLGSTAGILNHGYALMDLDGPAARVQYFQDSDSNTPLFEETIP
jgi:predicted phosphodiesterase